MLPKNFNLNYLNNLLGINSPVITIRKLMIERSHTDKRCHQDKNYVFWLAVHVFHIL